MTEKFDGLIIEDFIDRINSEHEKYGNLANEPVQRRAVIAIIKHFEAVVSRAHALGEDAATAAEAMIEQLQGELLTEQRRLNASKARETRLKNQLKECKESTDETRANTSD